MDKIRKTTNFNILFFKLKLMITWNGRFLLAFYFSQQIMQYTFVVQNTDIPSYLNMVPITKSDESVIFEFLQSIF